MQILVIDDHLLVREGLKGVLKRIAPKVQVFEAPSASEAVRLVTAHPDLDLVLLDLTLPDGSGLDTLTELRRSHPAIPIVVLSASTEPADVMRSIQYGAAGFIPKSSSAGVMLGALRLVLAGGLYLPPDILLANGVLWRDGDHPGPASTTIRPQMNACELGLSDRQAQVLALLVRGKTNKDIGHALHLAEQTVKAHISAVLRVLNVSNRTHAAVVVAQLGINLDPYLKPSESRSS